MNTNPHAKRILCYGDSNTRGKLPFVKERYAVQERWTGVLQDNLGSEYEVIEEGLRGRTTHLEESGNIWKSGLAYFMPCMQTHIPLDYIILFLGTNNFQSQFSQSPQEVANSFHDYQEVIEKCSKHYGYSLPTVILISPLYIDGSILKQDTQFSLSSDENSRLLSSLYKKKAEQFGRNFLDAGAIIGSGRGDGVHMDKDQHKIFGEVVASYISSL